MRFVSTTLSTVVTLAGSGISGTDDGFGYQSTFNSLNDIETDPTGSMIFVADYAEQNIRQISCSQGYYMSYGKCISSFISNMYVTTIIGSGNYYEFDGIGISASFGNGQSLCIHLSASYFITMKSKFHKVILNSKVTTTIASGIHLKYTFCHY